MSVLSALLAKQLVTSLFERIRWKLVSNGGVPFKEFDALSPNTGLLGCIQRLYWNARNRQGVSKLIPDTTQIYNLQKFSPHLLLWSIRIFFLSLHIMMSVILLGIHSIVQV
jgi:hypothetical protein